MLGRKRGRFGLQLANFLEVMIGDKFNGLLFFTKGAGCISNFLVPNLRIADNREYTPHTRNENRDESSD